jgi:hypothetical protein
MGAFEEFLNERAKNGEIGQPIRSKPVVDNIVRQPIQQVQQRQVRQTQQVQQPKRQSSLGNALDMLGDQFDMIDKVE